MVISPRNPRNCFVYSPKATDRRNAVPVFKDAFYFLRLSRPVNVLITGVAFALSCYISLYETTGFFRDPLFYANVAVVLLISATGYWINDVYDFRIDRVNKPERTVVNAYLSVKKVLTVYFIVLGVALGFSLIYFGFYHRMFTLSFVHALAVGLLFVYASWFKRVSVVGNLLIAFLVSLVILLAGYLYHLNTELVYTLAFAFQVTLLREITKDVEDIRGDLQFNLNTLPIQIGMRATRQALYLLYGVFLLSCYVPVWLEAGDRAANLRYIAASLLLVQIPVIWVVYLLRRSATPAAFGLQSLLLKVIMAGGMISLLFLP